MEDTIHPAIEGKNQGLRKEMGKQQKNSHPGKPKEEKGVERASEEQKWWKGHLD